MYSIVDFIQVDIGVVAACFSVPAGKGRPQLSYCVIQLYQRMDSFGTPLNNLFQSLCVNHTVSVVHECSSSCMFKSLPVGTQVERRTVMSHKLTFDHDFCNNIYSRNLYCMQ